MALKDKKKKEFISIYYKLKHNLLNIAVIFKNVCAKHFREFGDLQKIDLFTNCRGPLYEPESVMSLSFLKPTVSVSISNDTNYHVYIFYKTSHKV